MRLLAVTNAIRLLYDRQPLIWNNTLATKAQQWAETQTLGHDYDSQNLMFSSGPRMPIEKSVCHWMTSDGHRATLLSKEIKEVGCGHHVEPEHGLFVICNYYPIPTTLETEHKAICNHILRISD